MVVSFILDTEYMGVAERKKWFLKSISHAMKEDVLIVTHSYFKTRLREVVEECSDRFYVEFEMEKHTVESIEKLDICYIPDELFEPIYEMTGTRTKQLLYLYNNDVAEIKNYVIKHIDNALKKKGHSRPEYIMNSLHVFEFVRMIAAHYTCPIVPWVFSAIRKVHGYSQTLYMAHVDNNLYNSEACEWLYMKRGSDDLGFNTFDKRELLALLGKDHNTIMIPLMKREGKYNVGVVGEGFHVTPEIYQNDSVTDDDIYYACKKLCGSGEIITRMHPMQLDQAGMGRNHMKNDPVAFILNSKRVVTVQSQMIIKAAMWNRSAVVLSKALPYAFLLNQNVQDEHPIDDFKLNFIVFAYFVPDACMFSTEYWKWRLTNPSVKAIASRHLEAILHSLNIPKTILEDKDRFSSILRFKGWSETEISKIRMNDNIDNVPLEYPSSRIRLRKINGDVATFVCLNHLNDNDIVSEFEIPGDAQEADFIPQNDVDGCVKIKAINEHDCNDESRKYVSKDETVIKIPVIDAPGILKIVWNIKKYDYDRGGQR